MLYIRLTQNHVFPDDNFPHEESINCICGPEIHPQNLNAIIHNRMGSFRTGETEEWYDTNEHDKYFSYNLNRHLVYGYGKFSFNDFINSNKTW
jgi:hypothetical protein